jgi:hypothetical protein
MMINYAMKNFAPSRIKMGFPIRAGGSRAQAELLESRHD